MKLKSNFLSIFAVFALSMAATSTAWAEEVKLTSDGNGGYYVNMPATGTNTLVNIPEGVTTFKVYDDGGPNKNFSLNCDGNLVLVAPENHFVRLNGTMVAVQLNGMSSGSLALYNSEISQSNKVFEEYGNATIKWLSDGNTLILGFKNFDSRTPSAGLDLTVSFVSSSDPFLVDIVPVDGGNAVSSVTNVLQGALVSVTATPAEGYAFDHIEVYDERGNPIAVTGGTWLTSATGSFVMPATNAVVTPVFVAENVGPRVDMPWNGIARYTISGGLTVFGVYDYQFSEDFDCGDFSSPLVLTAPEGYVFLLREKIGGQYYGSNSGFYAFDGDFEDPIGTFVEQMDERGITSGRKLTLVHRPTCEAYGKMGIRLLDASVTHSVEVSYKGDGYVEDGLSSASAGNTIKLTATPDDGYMIGRISVDAISEYGSWWPVPITGGTWYTSNDYSFTMPYANVEVAVEFVEKMTTAEEGLFIEMPKRDSVIATIPEDVESFNVTGGCDGGNCKGTLVLAAPEGYKFQLSGSVDFEGENASLIIFDGSIAKALHQLELNQDDDVELNSSGDTLTLRNQAVDSYMWMNLRVTMYNPNKKYNVIAYNEIENGKISVDKESAGASETVTLTAIPAEGFVLGGIEAWWVDDDGDRHDIKTSGGTWYNNEVKFTMPLADVYYSAYFVPAYYCDYEINIPKTGNITLDIPTGVSQLTVYDDNSGSYGAYSNNSDGSVTLTAPEGYSLAFMGEITTVEEADSLVVYDGSSTSAKKLLKVYGDKDIEPVYSSGRSLTFHFKSNAEWNDNGLDLYVVVLKKSSFGAVAVYSNGGFTLARIDGNFGGKDAVSIPDAVEVNAIEFVREFTPGLPATVVLPFSLPEGASVNAKFYQLESVEQEGRSWVANMRKIGKNTTPKANTPYVIIPEDSELQFEFSGTATLRTEKIEMTWSSDGNWYFTGAYVYRPWVENDEVLGLAYAFAGSNEDEVATGDFGRMGEGSYIVPMRAYLSKANSSIMLDPSRFGRPLTLSEMSSADLPENIDVKFMDEDDKVMAIGRMNTVTGEFKIDRWYDLKGRSTNKMPTTKGAFYNKRVIVK